MLRLWREGDKYWIEDTDDGWHPEFASGTIEQCLEHIAYLPAIDFDIDLSIREDRGIASRVKHIERST